MKFSLYQSVQISIESGGIPHAKDISNI